MDRYKFQGSYNGSMISEEHINYTIGEVSFIGFANNSLKKSDLSR
ncbi:MULTISPECIES: hypothetical protein [Clostridium]|uniref:Uncharacterized protein n=2 Tax=Clostridium TaxID=1485 RepID=A0A151AQD0_9CLOT|nr:MULTISPECIES: hypothetical protein [Clostridium]KYH29844.1 hypothetical protein CLCOL_04820 [Clostridium colicanis DSM 13634]PRR75225.1 hypothetical protein CPAL_07770 [Clostridium thermopalmarium DSM 5974]PVZ27981.1 hypothetical protein LX19_00520 [Clostridium thermopalmarium DSM 5974]